MSSAVISSPTRGGSRWLRWAAVLAACAALSLVGYWALLMRNENAAAAQMPVPVEPLQFVSAIGRLEPKSRVVKLAAPMAMEPARIERLEVEEGDWVEAGALLAQLDTHARRQSAVHEAQARVWIAEAKLAQVKAGAKPGDIAAQQAVVSRDEAALKNAEAEWQRIDALATSRAVTQSESDRRRTEWQTAQRTLESSKATLAALREVREVDVKLAEAELAAARAAMEKAQADREASQLRAPFDARVLRIHARPGEKVGEEGVFEVADTASMQAVAEVYEADIGRVQVGQLATVRIPSMNLTLPGRVEQLGHLIGRKDVFDNDPVADTDARVVEVRIGLESADAKQVERLTNLRIEIRIDVSQEAGGATATTQTAPTPDASGSGV
jgi:HlyD family secretion protein